MNIERKCPCCESTNLEPGRVQSTGKIYFRPENTGFFTFGTNDIDVNANVCMECGHIMLIADLRKVKKVFDKAKPH